MIQNNRFLIVIVLLHGLFFSGLIAGPLSIKKNKYPNAIPTNITTLKIKAETVEEEIKLEALSTSPKSIYLLLEDS